MEEPSQEIKAERERIKEIVKQELERDFNTGRLKPESRFKHLIEHIFWKIDYLKAKPSQEKSLNI